MKIYEFTGHGPLEDSFSNKIDVQQIVDSFVSSPIGQKYQKHDCKTITRAFVNWAEKRSIKTQVISLAPPSAKFLKTHPQFKGKSGEGNGHIMPIVDNQAIDFTVRQFGVNRPFDNPLVTPVNALKKVYGKFGYFTDTPEWFLHGKSFWMGPLSSIPSSIFNQNFSDEILDEGPMWDLAKKKARQAALAGSLVGAAASQVGDKPVPPPSMDTGTPAIARSVQDEPAQATKPNIKSTSQSANQGIQDKLMVTAMSAGIEGEELAAFMAQMAHETLSFTSFVEKGSDAYFKKMYDIKGDDPGKAKLLGNLRPGDGIRYRGRGYIHLTGKDNYEKAEKATGHPLVKHPELAADPQVAADIAVWFWTTRVEPNVSDWSNTKAVTRKINPSMHGIEDREANFFDYKKKLKV